MLTAPVHCRVMMSHEQDSFGSFLQQEDLVLAGEWSLDVTKIRKPIVIAWSDDRIIGCARLYRSWLHPIRWRVAIHVAPAEQRQGVGSNLLRALCQQLSEKTDHELQASASAAELPAIGFLEAGGFELLMTTRLGILRPDTVPKNTLEMELPDDIQISTLEQRPDLHANIAHLHAQVYREQHKWDPPIQLHSSEETYLFLDPNELIPALQYIALHQDRPVGIASLRGLEEATECELGWIGVAGMSPSLAARIHEALWNECLTNAFIRNVSVHMEIDHADRMSTYLSTQLPIRWEPDWLTYYHRPNSPKHT